MEKQYSKMEDEIYINIQDGKILSFDRKLLGGVSCVMHEKTMLLQAAHVIPCDFLDCFSVMELKLLIEYIRHTTKLWSNALNLSVRIVCSFSSSTVAFSVDHSNQNQRQYSCVSIETYGYSKYSKNLILPYILSIQELSTIVDNYFKNIDIPIKRKKVSPGSYDIVFRSGWSGLIFHEACGHCLESDNVVRGTSIFNKKDIGKSIATPLLNIVDDPSVKNGGYLEIDDEGNVPKKTFIIKDGTVSNFLTDEKGAELIGVENNGHGRKERYSSPTLPRMTNLFVLPNDGCTEDDMISSIKDGIYVKSLGGGNVNISTGDFFYYVTEAAEISNGQILNNLEEFIVIDNTLRFLNNISAIADNLVIESGFCKKEGQSVPISCGQPSVMVKNVFVR